MVEQLSPSSSNALPMPVRILFQSALMRGRDGSVKCQGLINPLVTCYLNSVIQCLHNIPIWRNYLCHQHPSECSFGDGCLACILRNIAFKSQSEADAFIPEELIHSLPTISKYLTPFWQQDAHEFLICLFGKLQEQITHGLGKLEPIVEMTTALGQIFGGFLMSQIICGKCRNNSANYEEFFNISLEVDGIDSMDAALGNFFSLEGRDGQLMYNCEKCAHQTETYKSYLIHKMPEVLIVHLKRYDASTMKLNHFVSYPERLDLTKHVSNKSQDACYALTAVVQHLGMTIHSGHYTAFVRNPGPLIEPSVWRLIDDESVSPLCGFEIAGRALAYLLFYEKVSTAEEESETLGNEGMEEGKEEMGKDTVHQETVLGSNMKELESASLTTSTIRSASCDINPLLKYTYSDLYDDSDIE